METQTVGPHRPIIEKFGGIGPLAKLLGHRHPTTVQGWNERGWIPAPRQTEVLTVARENGIDLTPADFFQTTPKQDKVSA